MNRDEQAVKIAAYIALRDRKRELTKRYENRCRQLDEAMEELEEPFVQMLKDGGGSVSLPEYGRVHHTVEEKVQVRDADAFRSWICEDPETRMPALQARVGSRALAEIVESLGEVLDDVPGLQVRRKHRARFTKPSQS